MFPLRNDPGNDPDLPSVEALQAGDDCALDVLMERHGENVFRFIHRHLANEADARELAQETFVRAYFHIGTFRPTALFATWLFRIAMNLCRDHARSKAFRQAHQTHSLSHSPASETGEEREIAASSADPAAALVHREKKAAVEQAISALPEELKTPFILAILEHRSHEETALRLGLTAKAVESKIYRARKHLARELARMGF